jgi:hypothetical protein
MERCNFTCLIGGFLIGVIVTASVCYFTRNSGDGEAVTVVGNTNPKQANELRGFFTSRFPQEIAGINISKQQLDAINSTITTTLQGKLDTVSGFRLYNGLSNGTATAKLVSIVYPIGTDLRFKSPNTLFYAEGFNDRFKLPCPDFCN